MFSGGDSSVKMVLSPFQKRGLLIGVDKGG